MTPEQEIAWAAGFIDGDGHITAYTRKDIRFSKKHQKWVTYIRPLIAADQVVKEPLDRLFKILGGRLTGPYQYNKKHSPYYKWQGGDTENTLRILKLLKPFLCGKRLDQLNMALEKCKQLGAIFVV